MTGERETSISINSICISEIIAPYCPLYVEIMFAKVNKKSALCSILKSDVIIRFRRRRQAITNVIYHVTFALCELLY